MRMVITNICLLSLFTGLHQVGGVVVQIPGVAQAGTLLRAVGKIPVEPTPQESSHIAAIELKWGKWTSLLVLRSLPHKSALVENLDLRGRTSMF